MVSFWRNKNVLITGDSGFKGSWLTCLLLKLESNVTGLSLKPNETNILYKKLIKDDLFISKNKNKYKHYDLDIRDKENVIDLVSEINPEIIFHLAAQPLVRESYREPALTWDTNVMGTVNILEAIKNLNRCSVVVITTDKVYENVSWSYSYREDDLLGGSDPYSSSKSAVELAVKSWRKSFYQENIKISTARAGNVIGGGDWSVDRIVPDTISALINKQSLSLRYPNAVRPWQHVLDPLFGYLNLAEKQINIQESYAYNFGPDDNESLTVIKLVERIADEWGSKIEITKVDNQPDETNYLTLSIKKSKNELFWYPKWDLNKTISHTVNWYKNVYLGKSTYECILNDINNFFLK